MSILSKLLDGIMKDAKASVTAHFDGIEAEVTQSIDDRITDAVAKLPTAEALGQRLLGNPRLKSWLKQQSSEVRAAIKDGAETIASCALESITKDLKK